jgi:hypothetical protein
LAPLHAGCRALLLADGGATRGLERGKLDGKVLIGRTNSGEPADFDVDIFVRSQCLDRRIERESETAEDPESLAKRLVAEQPGRCPIGRIAE